MYQSVKKEKQLSIFDDGWIYKTILKEMSLEHPLVKLKEKADRFLTRVEPKLMKYYSLYEGRPAFPPSVGFKLLFLVYLYNISERAIAGLCIHDICDENGFVTNVETIHGNTNEGENLRKLVQLELWVKRIKGFS